MAVLITGGTGFLGAYLARYAVREMGERRVVVLDRYADRARIADVLDNVTVIEGDVSDFDTVRGAIETHGVDRVAHFASILGSPLPGQMIPYVRVQNVGTANVFEAARISGVKRVLFASSVAAYGRQDAEVLTEDLRANPLEPYGATKAWAEILGRHYGQELGLKVISLRFGSTYGLGRAWRGSYNSGLLRPPSDLHYMARIEEAARGKAVEMPRDDALADFTYAADAAQASWLALTAEHVPHQVYNVCAERRRVGEFTQAMRELLPDADIISSAAETLTRAHAPMDGSRLKIDLGFSPRYSLLEGLADYIERLRAYESCERSIAHHTPLSV